MVLLIDICSCIRTLLFFHTLVVGIYVLHIDSLCPVGNDIVTMYRLIYNIHLGYIDGSQHLRMSSSFRTLRLTKISFALAPCKITFTAIMIIHEIHKMSYF